jgi:hypothetical protein
MLKLQQMPKFQQIVFWLLIAILALGIIGLGTHEALVRYSNTLIKKPHSELLSDYSEAGEYLNFAIGVPLAVVSALAGVAVTIMLGYITHTKDDFDTLKFVEEFSRPAYKAIQNVAGVFNSICVAADKSATIAKSRIEDGGLDAQTKEDFEKIAEMIHGDDKSTLEGISIQFENFSLAYHALLASMQGKLFVQSMKDTAAENENTPIDHLQTLLPVEIGQNLEKDPKEIIELLASLNSATQPHERIRAYAYLPNSYTALDYLGMVIYSPTFIPSGPLASGLRAKDITVNIGLAYLLTLYRYTPNAACILEAFKSVMNVPSIAARLIEKSGPQISDFMSSSVNNAFNRLLETPERLIILDTEDRGVEFYQPAMHGSLRNVTLTKDKG